MKSRTGAATLRSRWNRAFAALFVVVVLASMANVIATHVVIGAYRTTAERVERDATLRAGVRTEIGAYSLLAHRVIDGGDVDVARIAAAEASVRAAFGRGLNEADSLAGRQALQAVSDQWELVVAGPADRTGAPWDAALRHRWLDAGTDEIAAHLTNIGTASRAAASADLAHAADVGRGAKYARWGFGLLVVALMLGFIRRLSSEVLVPLGLLRDSANQLAAGELDHRVHFDRADELGELAAGFNAMADAIALSQRSLSRQANHDSLTGLANRAAFHARLEGALLGSARRKGTQAVLFVDLDDFKDVNDTLGHAAGDEILRVAATRLRDAVRPGDLVARLGGDEFALLLDGCVDQRVALAVAERVVAALAEPVELTGTWVHVGASVGVAFRHGSSDPDSLMREADLAMYRAKGRGKNRVERYDASLNDAVVEHHALKAEDRRRRRSRRARPRVPARRQPRHRHDRRGRGAGALAAPHPRPAPPSAFIDLAEQTGAIGGIGAWVLERSARQLLSWQRRYGLPDLSLSVNVSVCQLDVPGYASEIEAVLRRTGLDPGCLVLEVTESVLADPAGGAAGSLETLRQLGVRVALDDFGTGYSSIGYLRQLPVDILKIDRSFVSGEHADRPGDLLLEAIVGLAQRLGLDVVPEGIETPEQLARLRALGCVVGQGFLMSRPVPTAAIDELLAVPMPLLPLALVEADASVASRR